MFCPECGAWLDDNAMFCGECGAKIEGDAPEDDALPLPAMPPEFAAQDDGAQTPQTETVFADAAAIDTPKAAPDPKQKRTRKVLFIAIAILAAVLLILGGVYLKQQSDYKKAHAKTDVTFTVNAPGYVAGTDSKIPLHVEGTDLDGKAVSEDAYIAGDGTGLSLMRGAYTVTVIASPLLSNGTIYDTPTASIAITIDENGLQTPASQLSITLVVTDALNITDTQIDTAYKEARAAGMDEGTATNLKNAVAKTHQDALDRKAAEEKAAAEAAAAEAAAKKAATHYENKYFSLDLPESWANNYTVTVTDKDAVSPQSHQLSYSHEYAFNSNVVTAMAVGGTDKEHFQVTLLETSRGAQDYYSDMQMSYDLGTTSSSPSYSVCFRNSLHFGSNSDIEYIKGTVTVK